MAGPTAEVRWGSMFRRRPPVHVLHIGKTGGAAVIEALSAAESRSYRIVLHDHSTVLADVPIGERVVAFVRQPVERFVSGFYSRKRQGKPRFDQPWSPEEREAFTLFPEVNDLAAALTSTGETLEAAQRAMNDIQHVRHPLGRWFGGLDDVDRRALDLVFVGFQETLSSDFARLCHALDLEATPTLPTDPVRAHRRTEQPPELSDVERATIEQWYADDGRLYADLSAAVRAVPVRRRAVALRSARRSGSRRNVRRSGGWRSERNVAS